MTDIDPLIATVAAARAMAPAPGRLSALVWKRGTMELRYYHPPTPDPQTAHQQDELYVVVSGTARFVCRDRMVPCAAHDLLFAPAGAAHRFEQPSADFAVWVVFYGPEGGERIQTDGGPKP